MIGAGSNEEDGCPELRFLRRSLHELRALQARLREEARAHDLEQPLLRAGSVEAAAPPPGVTDVPQSAGESMAPAGGRPQEEAAGVQLTDATEGPASIAVRQDMAVLNEPLLGDANLEDDSQYDAGWQRRRIAVAAGVVFLTCALMRAGVNYSTHVALPNVFVVKELGQHFMYVR